MQRPTLKELNDDNSAAHDQLLLLRLMCVSDFAHHYMLHRRETLRDLLMTAKSLSEQDDCFTDDEQKEFDGYCVQIQEYIDTSNDGELLYRVIDKTDSEVATMIRWDRANELCDLSTETSIEVVPFSERQKYLAKNDTKRKSITLANRIEDDSFYVVKTSGQARHLPGSHLNRALVEKLCEDGSWKVDFVHISTVK